MLLRIIIFGAHPDDAEYRGAGVAMKWAKAGHHVKLVSTTNGDIGHWQIAGGPLAIRRLFGDPAAQGSDGGRAPPRRHHRRS